MELCGLKKPYKNGKNEIDEIKSVDIVVKFENFWEFLPIKPEMAKFMIVPRNKIIKPEII